MTTPDRVYAIVAGRQKPLEILHPNGLCIAVVPEGYPITDIPSSQGIDVVDKTGRVVHHRLPDNIDYDILFCGSLSRA